MTETILQAETRREKKRSSSSSSKMAHANPGLTWTFISVPVEDDPNGRLVFDTAVAPETPRAADMLIKTRTGSSDAPSSLQV